LASEGVELLAGDDASAAYFEVGEAAGAHLVVEEVAGQAVCGNFRMRQ
jgi:hypothetical protein